MNNINNLNASAADYTWQGRSLSDSVGLLASPVVITISGLNDALLTINLTGDTFEDNYPVDFTVATYRDAELLNVDTVVGNTIACVPHQISKVEVVDTCVITITRISKPNSVAKLINVYQPYLIVRSDTGLKSAVMPVDSSGSVRVSVSDDDPAINLMNSLHGPDAKEAAKPTNIHSIMKSTTRQVYGMVEITYTDPLIEGRVFVTSSGAAYGSSVEQASDAVTGADYKYFSLYDNRLDGTYHPIGPESNVGWWSNVLSDASGNFKSPPTLSLTFAKRPLFSITVIGDDARDAYPVDFDIVIDTETDSSTVSVTNNNSVVCEVDVDDVPNAVGITLVFHKVNRGNYPVTISEVPVISTVTYMGSDLMSINMLEELSYEDEEEALGGVSANELTVVLNNADHNFYFNNEKSFIAKYLKKNRKVRAWLGTVIDGTIEWYSLGTYWSYKWDVPVGALTAQVVAFDTLGLLNTMLFYEHQVCVDKSIGFLLEYILEDAKKQYTALEWYIEPELFDIKIPYCWFDYASHLAALKQLSLAYPLHIYCDRDGKVIAKIPRIRLDYLYDTWSENTNVLSTSYPTLYTASPNHIDVEVYRTKIESSEIVNSNDIFTVSSPVEKIVMFSSTCRDNYTVEIDCDSTVTHATRVYSWGMIVNFAGSGTVRGIRVVADTISTELAYIVTKKDATGIALNGTIKRTVSSNLIQTEDRATYIANRIAELTEQDKYDAEVSYRGDIALSIDNPVVLADSIAPIKNYNIIRHELHWDGGLTGTATLNT